MVGIVEHRLSEERKRWRKEHPPGFYAKPMKKDDNLIDLTTWEAGIPGKEGTDWEGGVYKIIIKFKNNYPNEAPEVRFSPPIFHPNVYENGAVCLSILGDDWRPGITLKQILVGIQELLDTPNIHSPARYEAYQLLTRNSKKYKELIKKQAAKFVPTT